jgi:DNA-binding XRE family transcriptional regulator
MEKQNNLLDIRRAHQWSSMKLAVISGVSTATIVGIEKYGYYPGPEVRKRISQSLCVSEDEIWPSAVEVKD